MVCFPSHSLSSVMSVTSPRGDGVFIVQDTSEYLSSIHSSKGRSARWVRGLAPESEEDEAEAASAWDEVAPAQGRRRAAAAGRAATGAGERWLLKPILLGALYVLVLLLKYSSQESFDEMLLFDFPESEGRAWQLARRRGENGFNFAVRVGLPLAVPSGLAALGAGWLCLLVGSAAHHFTALCGVGTAMLSVLGFMGQISILCVCCGTSSVSDQWECDLPLTLYWICSYMRVGGPMLALWCAGPVMDIATKGRSLKYLLGLPALVLTTAVLLTVKNEAPAKRMFELGYEAFAAVWVVFAWVCWSQPRFALVIRELKAHRD